MAKRAHLRFEALFQKTVETATRLRLLPRLALGSAAGLVGGSVIYLAGWSLADEMVDKTVVALQQAFKPDLKDMIYAQTMAETLAGSESPAGSSVQVRVLSLAESVNEQAYFNVKLTSFVERALTLAAQNACIEQLVMAEGRASLLAKPLQPPACTPVALTADLADVRARRTEIDGRVHNLLSKMAQESASAQFEGDPRAEVVAANLGQEATLAGLAAGQLALNEALLLVRQGDVVNAFSATREYAVSSQSDFQSLEDLLGRLEYLAPETQAWHERHGDALARDPRWVDMKVAAGDSVHDVLVARTEAGNEYRNFGNVEGSLRAYIEEEKATGGAALSKAEAATAAKFEALQSAIEHTRKLDGILRATTALSAQRTASETNAFATLIFGVQIWHLTWGVLGGLVGALIGEFLLRLRDAIRDRWGKPRESEVPSRRYADAIFPLVGLMLAMVVSVRLADSLDGLTGTLITPLAGLALISWWGYLAAVILLGVTGTTIGALCGRFLLPPSSRDPVGEADVLITGGGGVLAAVVVASVLRWLVGPHGAGAAGTDIATVEAHLFALALIGGVFGSLIGSTLLSSTGAAQPRD